VEIYTNKNTAEGFSSSADMEKGGKLYESGF
jgi:hypothetical protein